MIRPSVLRGLVLAAISVTLAAHPVCVDDRRSDKSRLTIMTFNAEFLWDGVDPEEGSPTGQLPVAR